MSLINDALKRAQQVPPRPPVGPVPNPHLRPADASHTGWKGLGLAVPIALAGCALLLLVMYWRISNRDVQARATAPSVPAAVAEENPTAPPPQPDAASPKLVTAPEPVPGPASAVATTDKPQPAVASNATVVVEVPAKPVLPRLQGIIYNPSRPSAVLNGHTLFVGERLGSFRLVAITHDSATLVGGGETNLLTLEP